jgi:tRNA threonylcarbamoyladenosine biosynthesis protein TsaB
MAAILALDTSTGSCSVALAYEQRIFEEHIDLPREHARRLLPMIDKLLRQTGLNVDQLDAIAFTCGPGSFTGLRIGFGVVQGLAYGAGIPVIPVSTLEVMAHKGARDHLGGNGRVMPALDARMGEWYWGLYEFRHGRASTLIPDRVDEPARIAGASPRKPDLGVGSGWLAPDAVDFSPGRLVADLEPDAMSLLDVALPRFTAGQARPVSDVELAYLRSEVAWKKRERVRRR